MSLRRDLRAGMPRGCHRARGDLGLFATVALVAGLVVPCRAAAQLPGCEALGSASTPFLYVAGPGPDDGSAIEALAQVVAAAAQEFARIVYLPTPPCSAIAAVSMSRPSGTTGVFLDPAGGPTGCVPASVPPDLAFSDASPSICTATLGLAPLSPLGQLDTLGPIEPAAIVVPAGSPQRSISADAAYVVFGFQAAPPYAVEGWGDPASIFVPGQASGILNVIGQTIGLSAAHWAGAKNSKWTATTAMVRAIDGASRPASAIGVLPGPVAEHDASLRVLAYQHAGATCGYLPDSDAVHFDKINLRQGRYGLWAPIHMIALRDVGGQILDATGRPNARLAAVVQALSSGAPNMAPGASDNGHQDGGAEASTLSLGPAVLVTMPDSGAPPSIDSASLLRRVAQAGFVPWCAMQVSRGIEGDPESSFEPRAPCGCAFESAVGETTTYCTPCRSDADCTGQEPTCRFGYCEAQ